MKILITGTTGFIGGFIVDEALKRGMEVWAAVRQSSNRQWLTDPRIHFIELNLASQADLERQLQGHAFDYVVHAAGVTKCIERDDFYRINTEGTKNLVRALRETNIALRRFVYLSSLSVMGPVREQRPYTDIQESDVPHPNTAYGESKLMAEDFLETVKGLNYIILRPTGVYGPRERDYFMMAKSIKGHTDFAVGFKPQDITFIYVADLVQAIFLALGKGESGRAYFLSDGQVYGSRTFSNLIKKELGNPWVIRIKSPIWLLRAVTRVADLYGKLTGKITALNNDKYHILRQRNWRCDITPARRELGFTPQYNLEQGVKITIKWYKDNGWL